MLRRNEHDLKTKFGFPGALVGFSVAAILGMPASLHAATLCVNSHGTGGCYKTIAAAVAAASPNDTIKVSAGTYKEDVVIGKPLSLIGAGQDWTIINAKGLSNGLYIDGLDNPGLGHVVITGFTVESANFEGILIQNASFVTVWGNEVRDNDQGLDVQAETCDGQPPFETSEGDDCGEGIHLMGVDHSIISGNQVEKNAGGILVTDETAATHDNAITRNTVQNNDLDCGITLASHPPYVKSGPTPAPFGVFHNTISENDSFNNGHGTPGGGAGVGLFAPGPGNMTYGNSVVHNRLVNNGLPGVAVHNHAPVPPPAGPNVDDNTIIGNFIAGNGPDSDVPTTVPTGIAILGASPVTGLVIADNVIVDEDIDVAVNSASSIDLHLNDLNGRKVGIDNLNAAGTINATENWWGCAKGPGAGGCSSIQGSGVTFTPWLTQPSSPDRDDNHWR